jgi:hypothetical protein
MAYYGARYGRHKANTSTINGLQLGVAQLQSSGGVLREHRLLFRTQVGTIGFVFPSAHNVNLHNAVFLSFFFQNISLDILLNRQEDESVFTLFYLQVNNQQFLQPCSPVVSIAGYLYI